MYDFAEDSWRKLPDVLSKRVFAMYAATDKYILSIGGLIQPGKKGFSNVCEVFDLDKGKSRFFLRITGMFCKCFVND